MTSAKGSIGSSAEVPHIPRLAELGAAADALQRPLLRRSRFRARLSFGVGADASRRANGARGRRPRAPLGRMLSKRERRENSSR
jgi:hypothetical protein